MKNIKKTLVTVELLGLVLLFIYGIACAESGSWLLALIFMFGPFLYGKLFNLGKRLETINE